MVDNKMGTDDPMDLKDDIKYIDDLKIKTETGNFIFCPLFIIKDKFENPLLYLKFNRKEKTVLYYTNQHPESKNAAEKFKKEFITITKGYGEDWVVYDVIEYIKEFKNNEVNNDVKFNDFGIIKLS